jgi:hypothetical protein
MLPQLCVGVQSPLRRLEIRIVLRVIRNQN